MISRRTSRPLWALRRASAIMFDWVSAKALPRVPMIKVPLPVEEPFPAGGFAASAPAVPALFLLPSVFPSAFAMSAFLAFAAFLFQCEEQFGEIARPFTVPLLAQQL